MELHHCDNPECGHFAFHASEKRNCPICGGTVACVSAIAEFMEEQAGEKAFLMRSAALWRARLAGKTCRLVVAGPTGAGKSSFLNLLLGWPALQRKYSPHTTRIPAIIHNGGDCATPSLALLTDGEQRHGLRLAAPFKAPVHCPSRQLHDPPAPVYRRMEKFLHDGFWAHGERDGAWIGIDHDSWIAVHSALPRLGRGVCLIDTPGFAGDEKHGGLEADLVRSAKLWSRVADAILFVLDEKGLKKEYREEMLRLCADSGKPLAVFFNKMDMIDFFDYPNVHLDSKEEALQFAGEREEEFLAGLRDARIDAKAFFGCSVPPKCKDALARRWMTGVDGAYDWIHEQATANTDFNSSVKLLEASKEFEARAREAMAGRASGAAAAHREEREKLAAIWRVALKK